MKPERVLHCSREGDWSSSLPKFTYADGGRYAKLSFAMSPAMEWNQEQFFNHDRGSRGVCVGFSGGSRRRLMDRLNQVSAAAPLPVFATLTFPDDFVLAGVPEMTRLAKRFWDVLFKRLRRACPGASAIWRVEFEDRKSGAHLGVLVPHFHALIWGLPQRDLGEGVMESYVPVLDCQQRFLELCGEVRRQYVFDSKRKAERFADRTFREECRAEDSAHLAEKLGEAFTFMSFYDWVSFAWYEVVGTGNRAHFLAGCRAEQLRSWGGVCFYAAKYLSKENQASSMATGRSWGISNRAALPWAKLIELNLSDDVGNRVRRVARRYLEHKLRRSVRRPYGVTIYGETSQWVRLLGFFSGPPDVPF